MGLLINVNYYFNRVAAKDFMATGAYDFLNDSLYVGFYTRRFQEHQLLGVDRDGLSQIEYDRVDLLYPNLAYRSEDLNTLVYHGENVYLVPVYEQSAYVFDSKGKFTGKLSLGIDGFRSPVQDKRRIDSGDVQGLMHEVRRVAEGTSVVNGLYALNAEELLVGSIHGYVRDAESGVVTRVNVRTGDSESMRVRRADLPVYARNGEVYFVDIESEPIVIRIQGISEYWKKSIGQE